MRVAYFLFNVVVFFILVVGCVKYAKDAINGDNIIISILASVIFAGAIVTYNKINRLGSNE